jgi:tetratricopeptide (TPR) repeat protein
MMLLVLAALLLPAAANDAHQQAVQLFKQHRYADAVSALEETIKSEQAGSDDYRESAMLIGQGYFMLSQAPKAIPWLEKIPATNESSYMLGYAYYLAGQEEKSVAAFARLFGQDPQSAAAHLMTGQMLIKRQLEEAGVEEVKRALQMNPKMPEAHFLLGEIAMFHGKVADSISELQQELAINPNFSMAWYRLGDACVRQNEWDTAIANLQRAVWLNRTFSGPYILLGKCYFKKRDFENAERYLRQALDLDPKNYTATYYLGETLVAAGRGPEGRELLKKSASLHDQNAQIGSSEQ